MKQQITRDDVVMLGELAEACDGVEQAKAALVRSFCRRLDVEPWDTVKWSAVESYVAAGGRVPIETFLSRLGVGHPAD